MLPAEAAAARCAAHPSRPAADRCPTCGALRCEADRRGFGSGCPVCAGAPARVVREVGVGEALVRAAVATLPVSVAGGAIASEYVGASVFDFITPLLVGVVCGAVAVAAAGRVGRRVWAVRLVGVGYALIAAGYGFRFVVGGGSPFTPAGQVLPAYAAAAVGAWLWTQPPRRGGRAGRGDWRSGWFGRGRRRSGR